MASANQVCNGICADLPAATNNINAVQIDNDETLRHDGCCMFNNAFRIQKYQIVDRAEQCDEYRRHHPRVTVNALIAAQPFYRV